MTREAPTGDSLEPMELQATSQFAFNVIRCQDLLYF